MDQSTGSLIINKAYLDMEGKYKCSVATRKQDTVESKEIELNVIGKK